MSVREVLGRTDSNLDAFVSLLIETNNPKLEKQHQSDVHLSERLASLANHVCPIEDTSESLRISQIHSTIVLRGLRDVKIN